MTISPDRIAMAPIGLRSGGGMASGPFGAMICLTPCVSRVDLDVTSAALSTSTPGDGRSG
jgi:hypothetical protein